MGKSVQNAGTIIVVAAVALAAFAVGRMSSNFRTLDGAAFEGAYASCTECRP